MLKMKQNVGGTLPSPTPAVHRSHLRDAIVFVTADSRQDIHDIYVFIVCLNTSTKSYGYKRLYGKTVFRVPVKVRTNLKRRSAAVKVLILYVR